MALLDDMKRILRVSASELDPEVQLLIDAAREDMARAGVPAEVIDREGALVTHAVALFCKARFGYDNSEAARFDESYRALVCDLVNSNLLEGGGGE